MANPHELLLNVAGFEWDDDNRKKNWIKHEVRTD